MLESSLLAEYPRDRNAAQKVYNIGRSYVSIATIETLLVEINI